MPKGGGRNAAFTFYELDLLERYRKAKYQPVPYHHIKHHFNREFLEGLTGPEAAMLFSMNLDERRSVRVVQKARLIARDKGLLHEPDLVRVKGRRKSR